MLIMNVNDLKENVGGTIRRFDDETNICGQQRKLPMTTGIMAYEFNSDKCKCQVDGRALWSVIEQLDLGEQMHHPLKVETQIEITI